MALAAHAQSVSKARAANSDRIEVENNMQLPLQAYNGSVGGMAAQYCARQACDRPPLLLSAVAPTYPPAALRAEIEGRAVVVFDINANGMPVNVALEAATAPEFGEAGLKAIKSWRFKPAVLGGKAIGYRGFRQSFPFELRD